MGRVAAETSLVRVALSIPRLQTKLMVKLLEALAIHGSADAAQQQQQQQQHARGADRADALPLCNLVVSAMRWLEVGLVDPASLVGKALEVLPVCTLPVQAQLVGLLPEIVEGSEQERVVEALGTLLDNDVSLASPVLESVAALQLPQGPGGQALLEQFVEHMAERVAAVEIEDLAAVVKFCLMGCSDSCGRKVVRHIRAALHFVDPADPRFQVPDTKQKGPRGGAVGGVGHSVMRELTAGLQGSAAAAAAMLEEVQGVSSASALRVLDLWSIIALQPHATKQAETAFKAWLAKGPIADCEAWICKSLQGPNAAALSDSRRALLALAHNCTCNPAVPAGAAKRPAPGAATGAAADASGGGAAGAGATSPAGAGGFTAAAPAAPAAASSSVAAGLSHLYAVAFVAFEDRGCRQELLAALHGHLGSRSKVQVSVALGALSRLCRDAPEALGQYGSYLANVLDHLDAFSVQQLRQLFAMLYTLTSPTASSNRDGGGRLHDELRIVVNKAVSQSCPAYLRIGVVGSVAQLLHAAQQHAGTAGAGEPEVAKWMELATQLAQRCRERSSACLALLLDELAATVPDCGLSIPDARSGSGRAAPGLATTAAARPLPLPEPCAAALSAYISDLVEEFVQDITDGGAAPFTSRLSLQLGVAGTSDLVEGASLVFNVQTDVQEDEQVYLKLWDVLAGGNSVAARTSLVWLCPGVRLITTLECLLQSDLATKLGALVGLPLSLFPLRQRALLQDVESLPEPTRRAMLECLQATISYCREVVGTFAHLAAEQPGSSNLSTTGWKLVKRLVQLQQLEALLWHMLSRPGMAAAAERLPDLAMPMAAAAAAAAAGGAHEAPDSSKDDKALTPSRLRAVLLRKLRPLAPAALTLLALLPSNATPPTVKAEAGPGQGSSQHGPAMLAAASYLFTDLALKLAAAEAAAEGRKIGLVVGSNEAEPDFIRLPELLVLLQPLLPAIRRHLDAAAATLVSCGVLHGVAPQGNNDARQDKVAFGDGEVLLTEVHPAVEAAAASRTVAARLITTWSSEILRLLLRCRAHFPPGFLHALIGSLAQKAEGDLVLQTSPSAAAARGGAAGSADAAAVPTLHAFSSASEYLESLTSRKLLMPGPAAFSQGGVWAAGGKEPPQLRPCLGHDLPLLRVRCSLVAVAEELHAGGSPSLLCSMRSELSRSAGVYLETEWGLPLALDADGVGGGGEDEESEGFSWKGRGKEIEELVSMHVMQSAEPSELLKRLAKDVLPEVPEKARRKKDEEAVPEEPVGGFSALTQSTLVPWFRALCDCSLKLLQAAFGEHAKRAKAGGDAKRRKTAAAASAGAGKQGKQAKAGKKAVASTGQRMAAAEAEALAKASVSLGLVSHLLMKLCKRHPTKQALLGAAVTYCQRSLDLIVKQGLDAWRPAFELKKAEFQAFITSVTRGSEVAQAVCVEAKAKGMASLSAKVPAAKKSIEAFVYSIKEFMIEMGEAAAFDLKAKEGRDLQGKKSATLFPEEEEEEQAEGEGGEGGEGDDE